MATKKAPRKRKELDITSDIGESFKKNFDCSNIQLKRMLPLTDNQMSFYYKSQDPKTNMILLNGPAGSCKTYCAVYSAMELLKERKVDHILYIRSVVESSSKSMGYLPGELSDKFENYTIPLIQKLNEMVDKFSIHSLMEQEYIQAIPVNFVRGQTFNNACVIADESQNFTRKELTTIISRFGRNSKYFILGDSRQSDISNSGFEEVYNLFDTEFSRKNNIDCFKFDSSDIMRSPILKHIAQVLNI